MSSPETRERSVSSSPDPEPPLMAFLEERLRAIADEENAQRRRYESFGMDHDTCLCRAVTNVLSTDLALHTYSQIIDGLPTKDVVLDCRNAFTPTEHPVLKHLQPCPAAIDKARAFQHEFTMESLAFDRKLLQAYRGSQLDTQLFHVRLIELVSDAIHQIGVYLSKLDLCLHEGGHQQVSVVRQWTPSPLPPELRNQWWTPPKAEATLFFHPHYKSSELYPEEVHDVVGYWAENRILGGVTAFDRRVERSNPANPANVVINSSHARVTDRLCQLQDDQQKKLVEFLLDEDISKPNGIAQGEGKDSSDAPQDKHRAVRKSALKRKRSDSLVACPLPILPDDTNRTRWQYWEAICDFDIYRNVWERMPPTIALRRILARRPIADIDQPEMREIMLGINKRLGHDPPWKKQRADGVSRREEDNSGTEDNRVRCSTDRRPGDRNSFDWKSAWDKTEVRDMNEDPCDKDVDGADEHDGDDAESDGQEGSRRLRTVRDRFNWKAVTLDWVVKGDDQTLEDERQDS